VRSYDLLVVGTGPAGVQAALRARRAGRQAAVVERRAMVGGACIHTGTIPSKTLRQAVMDLSGFRHWGLYRSGPVRRPRVSMEELRERTHRVIAAEVAFQEQLLESRGIDLVRGQARFVDAHTLEVEGPDGTERVRGERILLAVGSAPIHPDSVPFDGRRVLDSDQILDLDELPRSVTVVGGGVIGSEYASIFSLLDVQVTLVNRGARLLPFLDESVVAELVREMEDRDVRICLDASVERIVADGSGVRTTLSGGDHVESEALLFCAGRRGAAPDLGLDQAGLEADDRGCIEVDDDFRTGVDHIFAAGDVIGFPSLASASREQGRVAACRALGEACRPVETLLPFGIYTVPEIAMVGLTEREARDEGRGVVTGTGRYEETARGQIIGDTRGLLKLVVDLETRRLIGAHLLGTGAAELVHMAQMAIAFEATYQHFVRIVMNYPTLARVYKVAAWDVLEQLGD
jgi:NAD(P) transhydrogenase